LNTIPHILADDDVNWPKLIFGAIFLIIWAISAFVSWINKQQQEAKRRRVREELEGTARRTQMQMRQQMREQRIPPRIAEGLAQRFPDVLLPPAPPPPIPQQLRRPMPIPRPPAQTKAPRRMMTQTSTVRPGPLPPPPILLEEVTESPIATPAVALPRPRAKVAVDAAALSKWMTPTTLRQQFILTEILQPPLALRPDAEHP
jgi:hypothetical protein